MAVWEKFSFVICLNKQTHMRVRLFHPCLLYPTHPNPVFFF